jgi:hypothetical protein
MPLEIYAVPNTIIMRIKNNEVTGADEKAEKNEMNTTSANARSVPVYRLILAPFSLSTKTYYSIQGTPGLSTKSHSFLCPPS